MSRVRHSRPASAAGARWKISERDASGAFGQIGTPEAADASVEDATPPDIETAGEAYARRFSGPEGAYLLEIQAQTVQRLLSNTAITGGRVLDVGGGHAQLTRLLLALGFEVWVQGSAPSCVQRLIPLMPEAQGRLHFVTSSLWALPFANRTFDLVVGIRLLAHVERWQALLSEMARVCRQGLLVEYPPIISANMLEPWLFALKQRIEGNTRRFRRYSKSEVTPVLHHLGLVEITERKQFLIPMVVHRALKRPGLSRQAEAWCGRLRLTDLLGSPALLLARRPRAAPELAAAPAAPRRVDAGGAHRVLLVAPQPFFSIAGTPLNISNMCRVLTGIGYEIHLATLPLGRDVAMPGLIYHRVARIPGVDEVPIGFSFAKLAYDVLLAVKTFRLLRRQRFAAVHAIEDAAFFAAPIARWFRTPMVADLDSDICGQLLDNGSRVVRGLAVLARPLRRAALRRSTCAITVAGELTRLVRAESPHTPVFEIKDVPGDDLMRPADPDAVERLRRELGLTIERLVVYTGNFDRRQGVETLIDAMPLVLTRVPDSLLLLIGGEPHQIEALKARAARSGVAGAVHLVGKRPVEQMPEFMAMAGVLVSPRLEPYVTPLKIYAYMASGRPIVATDLPTHTDVLDLNSAILTPPNAEGLAEGIVRAFNEPARSARLGLRARQLVEREHTHEAFKTKLAGVYAYLEMQGGATQSASPAD
jgi:glycosyltransferase involved in cell wall biosynthesis/ubiquinone/menaquinone biosynthesis C-methylase UbiE